MYIETNNVLKSKNIYKGNNWIGDGRSNIELARQDDYRRTWCEISYFIQLQC